MMAIGKRAILRKAKALRRGRLESRIERRETRGAKRLISRIAFLVSRF
jgi:hypothetical protein